MNIYKYFIGLFLLYGAHLNAQDCSGPSSDIGIKALAVQPSSPQNSCGKATIIAEWEITNMPDYRNECHLSTINLAIPEPFLGTTGTITIVASDGGNYFEPQGDWLIDDNNVKIDLLPNAVIPAFQYFTLTVSDMEIVDDIAYNNQNITMSTSHVAVDDNQDNDIFSIQTSTVIGDAPIITNIEANCTQTDLAINLSAQAGTNGEGISSYSWTGPNGFTSMSEDPSITVAAADKNAYTGTYMVTVTDANGCTTQSSIDMDGTNCLALPVELLNFEAIPGKNEVQLKWETATELNNSHFDVERSPDGRNFSKIGEVKGHGTTSNVIKYSITDNSPLPGKSYYRLKQIDFDGSYDYSHVEDVSLGGDSDLKVYPNPVGPGSEINILGRKIQSVKIYNMLGQLMIEESYDSPQTKVIISSAKLSEGVYIARVNGVDEKKVLVK